MKRRFYILRINQARPFAGVVFQLQCDVGDIKAFLKHILESLYQKAGFADRHVPRNIDMCLKVDIPFGYRPEVRVVDVLHPVYAFDLGLDLF